MILKFTKAFSLFSFTFLTFSLLESGFPEFFSISELCLVDLGMGNVGGGLRGLLLFLFVGPAKSEFQN